jgi:hypothetical protein
MKKQEKSARTACKREEWVRLAFDLELLSSHEIVFSVFRPILSPSLTSN